MFRQCRYWAATCFWALLALLFFGVLLKSFGYDAQEMAAKLGLSASSSGNMLGLLTFFAIYAFYDSPDDEVLFLMLYYPATAAMLNIVLRLLAESRKNSQRRITNYLTDAIVNVLWFAAALTFNDHFSLDIAWTISAAVIAFTIFILIFLIPLCSAKPDDIGFWNHSLDTAVAFLISGISGAILAAGLDLLLFALHKLFDIEIDIKLYVSIVIFCFTFIAPMIFLQFCPEPARESPGRTDRPGRNGLGLINYIFIPLVAAYLLTLYAYAVRIAIQAELPHGRVSMLVTISMAFVLLLIFFLFPVQFRKDAPKFDKQVLKYLPSVFLPLLVLMSIGIGRRLHDYGVTIKRLYLMDTYREDAVSGLIDSTVTREVVEIVSEFECFSCRPSQGS